MRKSFFYFFILFLLGYNSHGQIIQIDIDMKDAGRTFEGIGALSAGASSRLLIDYPEPYRSDILDYLFKPRFGANLWHLKVENGGDINSTDGSEPAYAHTLDEFLNPQPAFFNRGYEWWLIKEAKKRNPDIKIEILQWGIPGWIDSFYSDTNASFIIDYIKGLKKYHGIVVDYTGIHNEVMYDKDWIKTLRKKLDLSGLGHVKIDAGDLWKPEVQWQIAGDIAADRELREAVSVINAHVPELINFYLPPEINKPGIPVWSGESHAYGGDWYAASQMAAINNRALATKKFTKLIYWSLISSYPDFFVEPHSGMMKANTPWSGYYEVQPQLWIYAHYNQFAKPGWKLIESGCRYVERRGWSVVTLADTSGTGDYSMIIETMNAKEDQTIEFRLQGDFTDRPLTVWESSFKKTLLEKQPEKIDLKDGKIRLTLRPNTIYTLTTTSGQQKGRSDNTIPEDIRFPSSWADNFDEDVLFQQAPYFMDYHGAFEVVQDKNSGNRYLKQCATTPGHYWLFDNQPYPRTLFGDLTMKDVFLKLDFCLPDTGTVRLESRLHHFKYDEEMRGYAFEINQDGVWRFLKTGAHKKILKEGTFNHLGKKWHAIEFNSTGNKFTVTIDKKNVLEALDDEFRSGLISLSSGWNEVYYDNFQIKAAR